MSKLEREQQKCIFRNKAIQLTVDKRSSPSSQSFVSSPGINASGPKVGVGLGVGEGVGSGKAQ